MTPTRTTKHYSGARSKKFWARVWAVKPKAVFSALYLMGCALQEHEERMHQALEEAEERMKSKEPQP